MSQSFTVDENAGAGTSLSNIAREYNSLASQYGTSARLRTDTSTTQSSTKTLLLLKAPFINKNIVSITKKYTSLETDGVITQGAQIQGAITIKNTSAQTLSKVVLLEKIPSYLQ
jgi:hypothetical protein